MGYKRDHLRGAASQIRLATRRPHPLSTQAYDSTMSDREGHSGAPTDEDLSLPKATVAKMITGALRASPSSVPASLIRVHPNHVHVLVLVLAHPPLLAELLPDDVTCAKETRDLVIECCVGEAPPLLRCARVAPPRRQPAS